jgi:TetR/AcrR family transcriptional regulator, regulator of autoinduction and epiphytic fitness
VSYYSIVISANQPRTYVSARRTEQARVTRTAILEAALRLFRSRGYAATTRADIAREAGVAVQTVGAVFGTKRAILQQLVDDVGRGTGETPPLAMRSWLQELREQTTAADLLRHHARSAAEVSRRAAAVSEVLRRAAAADPDVAELWESLQRQRRQGQATVVHLLAALGPLRRGLTREEAADVLWTLTDDALYDGLVGRCGWTPGRFQAWLGDAMCTLLLD